MAENQNVSAQFYFEGDQYFHHLIKEILSARQEVILESYIFSVDPIGQRVLDALATVAKRGVSVFLMVDGFGSFFHLGSLAKFSSLHQIQFRVYHPLKSWKFANKRNHRKVILIDQQIAFLGSLNISVVHSKEFVKGLSWKDIGVRTSTESAEDFKVIRDAFFEAWENHQGHLLPNPERKQLSLKNFSLFRLNSKVRWRIYLLWDLRRRLRRSHKRILIINAYFLPRRSLFRALQKAAHRGVYVGLCLPAKTDAWPVRLASRYLYLKLLEAGVHIFEYQPSILHSKMMIIDDWATVGSHNLNHRSFIHDLEVEMVIRRRENLQELIQEWDQNVGESRPIHLIDLGKDSRIRRLISYFIYWFRYWL